MPIKPDPTSWAYQIHKRWRLLPLVVDENGTESEDEFRLMVRTPRGTGPAAASAVLVSVEAMRDTNNRALLAWAIRSARTAASEFRKTHEPPNYL